MALGKQVKRYRLFHGWKLEDLSLKSGVDVGTISAIEVRDSKRSEKAPALAKALGLTLEQLLDESADWTAVAKARVTWGQTMDLPESAHPIDSHVVNDIRKELHRPPYWPFTVSQEVFQRLLSNEDINNVDTFIQGIVKTRESDARKSRRIQP